MLPVNKESESCLKIHSESGCLKMKKTDELLQLLQEGVQKIQDGKEYKKYLKLLSSFPEYSSRNTLLIFQQCPQASYVAGYQTWKNQFGRQVRKGEKAIRIFAPYTYKVQDVDNEKGDETRIGFRSISVFDISQTEGSPLPSLVNDKMLCENVPHFKELFDGISKVSDYSTIIEEMNDERNGFCRYWDHSIHIRKGMPQLQTIKTLLHETAHSLLHDPYQESESEFQDYVLEHARLREIEAESVAYVVCSHFHLDCHEYSFSYIAGWKQQEKFFEESLERIRKTAENLIEKIYESLPMDSVYCIDHEQLSEIRTSSLIPISNLKAPRYSSRLAAGSKISAFHNSYGGKL